MKRFYEGVEVINLLLTRDAPVRYSGDFFNLRDAILLPRLGRPDGPSILIGGNGKKSTLPIAAQFGDELCCVYQTRGKLIQLNTYLYDLIEMSDCNPGDVVRSMLTGCIFGRTKSVFDNRFDLLIPKDLLPEMKKAVTIGDGGSFVDRISRLVEAGLEKIMLIWYDLEDYQGLELLAKVIF
jgi:alkanesulfonate monooxygenase SsuD/methylene tetrahydromethanopterin reductase-like flavin-dependent oxidoreductase (luciferase family)